MKIFFFTPWYPDQQSPNSGIFIRSQAVALAKEHDVVVVSSKVEYRDPAVTEVTVAESVFEGVREFRIVMPRSIPFFNQVKYLMLSISRASEIGQKFRPDIIHASIGYPGAFVGWRLSKKLKVPFVFTEHTRPLNNFRSAFHKRLTLEGMKRATAIMVVSKALAKEMHALMGREMVVIPNIVEVQRFEEVFPSNEITTQIGFVGGMNTNVKGLDVLLSACAALPFPFVLHIAGSGVLMDQYRKQASDLAISEYCKFYGFVQPGEIADFYARLHFLVCASRFETFNVSLVEAMACGMPVVSTRCGGPEDFVNDANGILCEKENVESLRLSIERMAQSRASYSAMAIKKFAASFGPERIAARLLTCYKDVTTPK